MISEKFRAFQENLCSLVQQNIKSQKSITLVYAEIEVIEKDHGPGFLYIAAIQFKEFFESKVADSGLEKVLVAQDILDYMDSKLPSDDLDILGFRVMHYLPRELKHFKELTDGMFEDQKNLQVILDDLYAKLRSCRSIELEYLLENYDFCKNFVMRRILHEDVDHAREMLSFWKEKLIPITTEKISFDPENFAISSDLFFLSLCIEEGLDELFFYSDIDQEVSSPNFVITGWE
jgi:hypothetical protein